LAVFEWRDWKRLGTSYCISEEVRDSQSLPAFWQDIPIVSSKERVSQERREVLREVASHFYRLHSRDIYHQDLKGENILIRKSGTGEWQCFFIDVDGVRKSRRLSQSKKVKNLAQLYRTLGKRLNITNKMFFLKCYGELFSLSRQDRKTLAQRVLSMSRKEDLRSQRKRAKRNLAKTAL
jgi:tRNA A-37 threonylcarbamoyl transferase component Bud32